MSKTLKILVHIELCIALIAIGYFIRKPETDTVYKYETVSYNFQPQIKTVITERKFRPFIGIGITNQPTLFGQAGLIYKNYGIGAIYQYPQTVGASFIYLF